MLRFALVFGILSAGIIAALFNRFAGLMLYLWFALFRPQEFLWFDITSLHLSLWIGALLVIPALLTGVWPNLTHLLSIGSVLFLISGLIAQWNAVNPALGWMWLDYLARLVLVSLLAVTLVSTPKRFVWTTAVMAGSFGFYSAKAGLASLIHGGVRYYAGLAGAFIDNNGYALGTAMMIPLMIAAGQNVPSDWPFAKWIRRGFYLAVPLSAFLIICTFSRAGFLALLAGTAAFALLQRRRFSMLAAVVLVVAIVGPFVPMPQGYFERMETIRTYEEVNEDSALGRLHFWRVAIDMAEANPMGVGLRNFDWAYDRYDFLNGAFGHNRSVHNSHLQVLAENGFFGFAVYCLLFFYALVVGWRVRRRALTGFFVPAQQRFFFTTSNALLTSMMAFLVGGAFIALALNDLTWLTFALVAALDRISRQPQFQAAPAIDRAAWTDSFRGPVALEPAFGAQLSNVVDR